MLVGIYVLQDDPDHHCFTGSSPIVGTLSADDYDCVAICDCVCLADQDGHKLAEDENGKLWSAQQVVCDDSPMEVLQWVDH